MKKQIGIFLLLALWGNANAAYQSKSSFGFIDLLWWQARESGAENWAQRFSTNGTTTSVQLIDAPFSWNMGVRLGVGYEFNQRADDILLAYTHYNASANNQTSGTVASAFDGAYFANNLNGASLGLTYNSANANWQLSYRVLDLNLGRHFTIDPVLAIHPYIGLKAARINQSLYTNWFDPNTPTTFTRAAENLKNNFSGLGPMLGADTDWIIYRGSNQSLSLIGNFAAGLLYGHWDFDEVYTNNKPVTITIYVDSVNGASPVVTGLLGVQWFKQFAQADLNIRLGYEAQIWFNQMQFYSLSMGRVNRPLSVQGGNLEFRLNI